MTKFLGISGAKKAGKTMTIEYLTPILAKKGLVIGTIKIPFKAVEVDVNKEGYDIIRLRKSSSKKTLFKSSVDTTIFYNEELTQREAFEEFSRDLDLVLIEGFKEDLEGIPQIVLLKEKNQEEKYTDEYTTAISSIPEYDVKSSHPNFVPFNRLAEIVEEKALPLFPDLNCGHCGYDNCNQLVKAIIAGEKDVDDCEILRQKTQEFTLKINNREIPCNPFVRTIFKNVILGVVKSLKMDSKKIELISLNFLNKKSEEHNQKEKE
ncbi:MAG: hypothetical protein GF308_11835 [Candidatus Heimdallarchaeota archaeon]|nr:hypothetical protein [Candidatus Heimdallarchaeota archaeon]